MDARLIDRGYNVMVMAVTFLVRATALAEVQNWAPLTGSQHR